LDTPQYIASKTIDWEEKYGKIMAQVANDHEVLHDQHDHHAVEDWSGGVEPFNASYGKLMMWYFLLSDAFTFAGFLIAYGTLRFSSPSWPVPDFVFTTFPGFGLPESMTGWTHHAPLMFVSLMTFILIVSSVTMVRAVQEGHRGNKSGVVKWMIWTILGGTAFLGCQAWEWTTLIAGENVSVTRNPFGRHESGGKYLDDEHGHALPAGKEIAFKKGDGYLLHPQKDAAGENIYNAKGELQFIQRRIADEKGNTKDKKGNELRVQQGPKAFGALFFFITGFHGFHVFSGVLFLAIIAINVASGLYEKRNNHYEMVEKIGLYWHFVDLVWVFVFLVFYLL
jgi:cytochrome c oxidase subunit III